MKVSAEPRRHWLTRYGLPPPDGRPLFQYRLDAATFERLGLHLCECATDVGEGLAGSEHAALFVLWAAEWFRRRYAGGGQRWDALAHELGWSLSQAEWRGLTDSGLSAWRLPELRLGRVHHRLAAIARQGGFPVAALEGGPGGWAARHLQTLVMRLNADPDPTPELAEAYAAELETAVPPTWRGEEMRAVCAELALAVVRLHRQARAEGAVEGALVSAWLDRMRPDWRAELPVGLDAEGGRALVDGLLAAAPLRARAGAIRARRVLAIEDGRRREQVVLTLEGKLEGDAAAGLARDWSRLRLFASGELARFISGELAVAEPTDEGGWAVRPVAQLTAFDVPFATAITLELRGDGRRVADPFTAPGGEALQPGLRVLAADEEGEPPARFTVVGSSGGGYRAEPLHLDVPAGWAVRPHGPQSEVLASGVLDEGARRLWQVCGPVLAVSGDGDLFLVRPGQDGNQRDRLVLHGDAFRGGRLAEDEDIPLLVGSPRLKLVEGLRTRLPGSSEAWWRRKGERAWRAAAGARASGACEFSWRDPATGHVRAQAQAVVLPAAFTVIRSRLAEKLDIAVEGWPGAVVFEGFAAVGPTSCRIDLGLVDRSWCVLRLEHAGQTLRLRLSLPHSAHIARWSGGPALQDAPLALSTLNRHVARASGPCVLVAELLDAHGRLAPQGLLSWPFEDELPLWAVQDNLAALLRGGGLDARVRLSFHDGSQCRWTVCEFDDRPRRVRGALVPGRPVEEAGVRVVGRSLAEPEQEKDFGPYAEDGSNGPAPFRAPRGAGCWQMYLRSNTRVHSRPILAGAAEAPPDTAPPLTRAMAIGEHASRQRALDELASALVTAPVRGETHATVRALVRLTLSLNGLPPSTFDVFARLRTHPALGPMMLFAAAEAELEALLRLEDGLAFMWCLVPKACWDLAFQAEGERLLELLPDRPMEVAAALNGRRDSLARAQPALSVLLDRRGSGRSIVAVANDFLNQSHDLIRTAIPNPFRPALESVLPQWSFDGSFSRALDAPLVAAAIACGRLPPPTEAQIICLKDIARSHPRYFADAFAAALEAH